MILAQVVFGKRKGTESEREELRDLVNSFLIGLLHSGQIYEDFMVGNIKGELTGFVNLTGPDAILESYHSQYAKKDLQKILECHGASPKWTILDDSAAHKIGSWKTASSLYLFTTCLGINSPVNHGDTGALIPVYTLPLEDDLREKLYFWGTSYRHHDAIFMNSGKLEIPAYRQMVEPESLLSKEGRELCKAIELSTGIPTYYNLYRYWGRKVGEDKRVCPGCGKSWRVKNKERTNFQWHISEFRCKPCRLVSHLANNTYDDDWHAGIGEYRKKKAQKAK